MPVDLAARLVVFGPRQIRVSNGPNGPNGPNSTPDHMARISSVQVHATIDCDVAYFLECPPTCHHYMRVGLSLYSVSELTEMVEIHDTGFKIYGLRKTGAMIDFFRIPESVIDALRAQSVKRLVPYIRAGIKDLKLKTGPENAHFVCDGVVTI
jgi:hypothetical protein